MSEELKPCPWCGSANIEVNIDADSAKYFGRAKCIDCGTASPDGSGWVSTQEQAESDARADWNDRPAPVAAVGAEPVPELLIHRLVDLVMVELSGRQGLLANEAGIERAIRFVFGDTLDRNYTAPAVAGVPDGWRDELDLIRAVLEGFPASPARNDALRAVRALLAAPAASPAPALVLHTGHRETLRKHIEISKREDWSGEAADLLEILSAGSVAAPSAQEWECCGSPVVGAEYMGSQEVVCCGKYEPAGETVAQGGGVDVEKVMALVQEFGEQCEAAGYLDRSGSQDASKKLHDTAYQTVVKIRALLSASPAVSAERVAELERIEDAARSAHALFSAGGNDEQAIRILGRAIAKQEKGHAD